MSIRPKTWPKRSLLLEAWETTNLLEAFSLMWEDSETAAVTPETIELAEAVIEKAAAALGEWEEAESLLAEVRKAQQSYGYRHLSHDLIARLVAYLNRLDEE